MNKITLPIYNLTGESVGNTDLDAAIFGASINPTLVQQALVAFLANRRTVIASTKDRSAVSGGGKKPWRQKGTGNARAGSSRSPLWRAGGITFGPDSDRNYSVRLPQKMRQNAWKSVLSSKVGDNKIVIVDSLDALDGKTKTWIKAIAALAKVVPTISKKVLVVSANKIDLADRAIRNMESNKYITLEGLTIYDMVHYPVLILTSDAVAALTERLNKDTARVKETA